MATIANLAVSLTAKIGNFQKGFKKAQRIAKRFGRDMKRHIKTIAGYGAAIAAVAATALSAFVKQQLTAVDATAKLSRTLGLSTEELVGYQHAASLANVDSESLSKSITRMNRTIADAESGLSTAKRELDRVGLSVQDLAGLSTDQRIKLLADRYNSIGDAADRASFLMNIFGRAGVGIGNMFEQGAEGIAAAQAEVERLGLTFSDIDGSKVEAANDAMTRAGHVITGIARKITVQLAPYIQVVADRFREFAMQGNLSGEAIVNVVGQISKAFAKLADIFELLKAGWNSFVYIVSFSAGAIIQPAKALIKAWNRALEFLGMETDRNFENFLGDLTDGFANQALEAASKAEEAFAKFNEGFNSNKVHAFFESVEVDAAKASKAIENMVAPDLGSTSSAIESVAEKSAGFRQVNLSRVAFGGVASSDKGVSSRQGESMISNLQQIARNTSQGQAIIS